MKVTDEEVTRFADMFAALGTEPRLRIVRLLLTAHPDGLVVSDIQAETGVAGSTLSHHLKALVAVGLVTQTREGTTLICHTNYDLMRGLLEYMVEECCAEGSGCAPVRLPRVA